MKTAVKSLYMQTFRVPKRSLFSKSNFLFCYLLQDPISSLLSLMSDPPFFVGIGLIAILDIASVPSLLVLASASHTHHFLNPEKDKFG